MKLLSLFVLLVFSLFSHGQSCAGLDFQLKSEIPTTCFNNSMTMLHDRLDRPYLYVANKESGLMIYNISAIENPVFAAQIPISLLNSLHVMNLSQQGNYLYLALGNSFNSNQASGMAIIDINNPSVPLVSDTYELSGSIGGSGIVETEGNTAYLCAMGNGIVVLDITDKANIVELSQFIPDLTFPDPTPDTLKINARGLAVRNDTLFLCYDAGGFRMIYAGDKSNLVEVGKYSNPVMDNLPRAYNNIVLENNLAYIAVDYCGLEILDFSNASQIELIGWWNPYNCPTNNWFTSPVHSNEIKLKAECHQIFLSTGKSDLVVVDVTDPTLPDSCNFYGGVTNNIGTWGVDVWKNNVFLSYICAFIPFASNWTGVKCIEMANCAISVSENQENFAAISVFPNPANATLEIHAAKNIQHIKCFDVNGIPHKIEHIMSSSQQETISVSGLASGIYFLEIKIEDKNYLRKIVVSP